MPKQTAIAKVNEQYLKDRENGYTREYTNTENTARQMLEEYEQEQREEELRRQQRQYAQYQSRQNAEIADWIKEMAPSAMENAAQQERVQRMGMGSNALTPEMEARYQQANGVNRAPTAYQTYMMQVMNAQPRQEETRSTDELRRNMNRQNRIARGTERMAADMAGQGLRDQSLIYNPTYTSNLRTMGQTMETQQAKADRATELYQALSVQRREQEEREKYAALMSNPDFVAKSQGDPTIGNKTSSTSLAPAERLYQKIFHRNDTKDANGNIEDAAGSDAARFVNDEEAAIFYYLWNTQGAKAAQSYYYGYVENRAGERRAQLAQQQAQAYGEYDPVGASIARVGYNAMSGIGLVDMALQNLTRAMGITDRNKPLNYNSDAQLPGQVADALQSGASSFMEQLAADEIKRINPNVKHPENYAKVASFLYQTGMSMADSSVAIALNLMGIPEPLTLANMGASAGTRAIRDARERGATDGQALAFGFSSAIMEALFEKISLDRILEPSYAQTTKAHLLNALKQSFTEGSEEVMTTLANTAADMLIMGDKAELYAIQRQLMEQGVSEKEALSAAFKQWGTGIVGDLLGGMISGFGMGGAKEVGTGLGIFAQGVRQDVQTARALTDYQNAQQAAPQITPQQTAPATPQAPVRQLTAREQNPLQFALNKAQNGETVTGNDAKAILNDPQAMQTLRDAGVLADTIRPGAEGRAQIQQAVQALAEQNRAVTAELQQETERNSQLPLQNQPETPQERTTPPLPQETMQERTVPPVMQEMAQERTTPPLPRQMEQEQQERVSTPPVPQNAQNEAQEPTLRVRAQEEKALRQEQAPLRVKENAPAAPTRQAPLTIRGANATVEENRQEESYGQGQQTETAAAAGEDDFRSRAETAAEGARRSYLDRIERSSGLGRVLQDLRNYRVVRGAESRASEVSRIRNQAEAGNQRDVSALDYGIANGSAEQSAKELDNATASRVLGRNWDRAVAELARQGVTLKAMTGQLKKEDGTQVRAFFSGDRKTIVVQVDHPKLSWNQLLDHEDLHRRIKENPAYRKAVEDALLADKKLQAYLPEIIDRYAQAYARLAPGLSSDDVIEELLADYRAGFDMLDPLGMNPITARAAKRAAKDIKGAEKERYGSTGIARQEEGSEPRTAAEKVEKYSLNPETVDYAVKYVTQDEKTKNQLNLLKNDTLELANIQQTINKQLGGQLGKNIHTLNDYLKDHPTVWQRLWDIQEELIDNGIRCDFVTEPGSPNTIDGEEVPGGLKGLPIEYVASDTGKRYKFTAFWRSMPQMLMDSMTHDSRERLRTEIMKGVEDAYARRTGETDLLPYLKDQFPSAKEIEKVAGGKTIGNIKKQTQSMVQPPLRSAEKTVAALNLNSACPMFTIGNNGCYLDACYLTQMANGATGTNLFRSAWYTGELLQLANSDIDLINKLGGLRINGVGDTTLDNKSQLKDAIRHAGMRGLKVKMITKQRSSLEVLAEMHNAGVDVSHVTVQPSMDNLWIPAELDDVYGAGVRGNTQLAETVKAGRLEAAASGYEEMFGRATKIVDGTLYRKYGFTPEQIREMKEDFPFVNITPRYVVCTAKEIAEIALNRDGEYVNGGKIIQTLMHGKVPSGCISDYPGDLINFGGARHVVERRDGKWHFYGEYIGKGGAVGKIIDGPTTPYGKVQSYVENNYTKAEQDKIWLTLKNQMCCQANDFKDACAGCQSLCARGCGAFSAEDFDYRKYSLKEKAQAMAMEEPPESQQEGKASTEIDTDYLAAVNSGDMETAQRMVLDAGKQAGYEQVWAHGSRNANFTVFDLGKATNAKAIFLSDPSTASNYSNTGMDNVQTRLIGKDIETVEDAIYELGRLGWSRRITKNSDGTYQGVRGKMTGEELVALANKMRSQRKGGIYYLLVKPGKQYVYDANGENWNDLKSPHGYSTDALGKWAYNEGYNSVLIENVVDGSTYGLPVDVLLVFSENQVKSADPVTYDDNGNVIPLSERFNPADMDIRYSIEIDPEVAAQFSPEAIARRQSNRAKGVKGERKVSRVRSNTYEYSGLYNEVEAQMDEADEENYTYDPVSEKKSMNEALGRLKADFDGEVSRLSEADRQWGGSDLDTAMGILHRYRTEGRATGDYGDFWRWSKVIQEKGTKGGQFIQAFAKYTRTGTGAAMKGAKDIHDRFKLNPAQQKQVDAAKKKLMDGIDSDMSGAAQDAMKQAKGQKEPSKKQDGKVDKKKLDAEVQRRKDAERLVREISKLFEKQQDHGEPVENWLNLTGEELARKIAGRFSEPKQRTKTTMQTILSDLVGFAEEHALPDRKKAEGTKRTAIDIITDYLNNRDAYGTAWAAAQSYLRAAYTDDQEKLDALNSFLTATIAYNAEGTDRTMLDAILQSADVLGISEKRILELTSAGATASTIDRIGDELVNQVKERMGADYDESFTQQLKDAVRRHITGIALQESAEDQRLRLGGMTTDAARQLEINLQKLLTQSRGDKNKAAQSVADYLIRELGIPSSDAAIAAERITGAFMDELASRADRKLQQMFAAKAPKTQEQRDRLLDLIRLGGLTNSNVEDAVVDALGIGGMSRERQRELVGVMAQFGETLDAMEADDLDGLKDLIRAQAAVRNTPLSRQAEKTLAGETDAEYLREFALAQLDAIAGDFAEMSPGAKISTFQTISHLLNMRTALRNLTSNQVFDLVDSAANNLATIPDMVIGAFTGKRTVGVNKSWLSEMKRAGAKQGAARNALEVRLDVSPDDRQKSKYGTAGRRTNSMAASNAFGRILSHLEEVMGYELNTTDEFHKGSVRGETLESLARFVERGDITQEQANAWAEEEALYRSFQDDTLVGNIMGELKTLLNVIGFGDSGKTNSRGRAIHDFGLGDLVVKYTQVPGALIHRGIEYSPLGYAKMLYDLAIAKDSLVRTQKRGEDVTNAQRKLALDIGRATTGSGLITLFAVLAKAGLLRRDDDDKDKNAKAMHAAQGLSGTQLNLTALKRWIEGGDLSLTDGDVLADIGFLEPLDSLMTIATLMANDNDLKLTDIGVKSLDGVWKAISNTSAMQTISNIISTVQYHDEENDLPLYFQIPIEIASDSVSGFIPSPVRQLAQATDTTYRDQYRSKALNDQIRAKVMNSIPGVRQMLAPKITPLGEDKKYQKPLLNYLNATLNPGNINVYQGSHVVDELNRVYGETDDAKIWPERNAPYSFTMEEEKYTLTPDERTQYQRTRGQQTNAIMEAVMGTDWYKAMGATDQADVLNWIGNFSNYIAKKEMLAGRGVDAASKTYDKYYEALMSGTSPEDVVASAKSKVVAAAEETAAAVEIIAEAKIPEASKEEAETMSAEAKRYYAGFLKGGVSDETARKLATEMEGSEASGHEQWRMVYDAAGKEGEKAVTSVMTDDMKRNWDLAKDAGVSMDAYIKVREGFKDLNGNGNKSQDEWNATLDSFTFSTNSAKDKSIKGTLWQILTGSGSTKNNPYDKEAGQKVIDAKNGGGSGSGSYAPARIPTLRIPEVPKATKPSSGLRIRTATPAAQAPRSGLRIKAQ